MTPKPQGKANLIHQQILAGLIATKPTSWVHKQLVDKDSAEVIKTKITGSVLVNRLAQNVSEENVDRMAKRWAA